MDSEIREELRAINGKLDNLTTLRPQVDTLSAAFVKHVDDDRIFFLGTDNKTGLVVAVDRLEVAWGQHQKIFWLVASVVVALGAEALWKLVAK